MNKQEWEKLKKNVDEVFEKIPSIELEIDKENFNEVGFIVKLKEQGK